MGNLGRYQEIVEVAKRSGGVDAMLDVVKKGAVDDAAPRLMGIGAAAGAVLTVGVTKGPGWVRQALANRREHIQQAEAAEQELREVLHNHQPYEGAVPLAPRADDSDRSRNNEPETSEGSSTERL